jgi:hypothetical protein
MLHRTLPFLIHISDVLLFGGGFRGCSTRLDRLIVFEGIVIVISRPPIDSILLLSIALCVRLTALT